MGKDPCCRLSGSLCRLTTQVLPAERQLATCAEHPTLDAPHPPISLLLLLHTCAHGDVSWAGELQSVDFGGVARQRGRHNKFDNPPWLLLLLGLLLLLALRLLARRCCG